MIDLNRLSRIYLFLFLWLISTSATAISENRIKLSIGGGMGLKQMEPGQKEEMLRRIVHQVKPNNLAVTRFNRERIQKRQGALAIPAHDSEFDIKLRENNSTQGLSESMAGEIVPVALPEQVDNSKLDAFPPIGDQGQEGSCVTWAVGYYQSSHEYCLENKCKNKISNRFHASPRFIYNMINSGADWGSFPSDAYNLVINNGYATLAELPYVAGNYLKWDLNTSHWVNAISRRALSYQSYPEADSEAGMRAIKQTLANGHLLTFGTSISNWDLALTGSKSLDGKPDAPFGGQQIGYAVMGSWGGGHMMTIVGYDDRVWVDINRNEIKEDAELGAFKIANSWGAEWGNQGFIWLAYDALRKETKVPDWAFSPDRVNAFWDNTVYGLTQRDSYSPRMISKFTVGTAKRNTMRIAHQSSPIQSSLPNTKWVRTGAFQFQGGPLSFDGGAKPVSATFAVDLTDLIDPKLQGQNFYLQVKSLNEIDDWNPTLDYADLKVYGFSIEDVKNKKTIASTSKFPFTLRDQANRFMIGYVPKAERTPIIARITALKSRWLGKDSFLFSSAGSSTVNKKIVSYEWDFGDGTPRFQGTTVLHRFTKQGNFTVILTVTDNLGFKSSEIYLVNIPDTQPPTAPNNLAANVVDAIGYQLVSLSWKPATDNVAMAFYEVYRNDQKIATLTSLEYDDVPTAQKNSYFVVAVDKAGLRSQRSNVVSVEVKTGAVAVIK